jgi:hypothetical protein
MVIGWLVSIARTSNLLAFQRRSAVHDFNEKVSAQLRCYDHIVRSRQRFRCIFIFGGRTGPPGRRDGGQMASVVDAGNYAGAFAMFPARIRSGGDAVEKYWVDYLRAKRAPLGRALSRKLGNAWFSRTLSGPPDGYYELFHYNTSFQRKTQAAESVVLTKESGHWQVPGYRFR